MQAGGTKHREEAARSRPLSIPDKLIFTFVSAQWVFNPEYIMNQKEAWAQKLATISYVGFQKRGSKHSFFPGLSTSLFSFSKTSFFFFHASVPVSLPPTQRCVDISLASVALCFSWVVAVAECSLAPWPHSSNKHESNGVPGLPKGRTFRCVGRERAREWGSGEEEEEETPLYLLTRALCSVAPCSQI